jgi:hypothetical protein
VPTVAVSENGILTCAMLSNNGTDATPSGPEITSGTTAPSLAFYSWRDFNLAEAGSGAIRYEEVAVGPQSVLCVTWDGVEAPPNSAGAPNPSTWQFQLNLSTGAVDVVWQAWDPSASTDDTLVGVTLAGDGTDPGSKDLAAMGGMAFVLPPIGRPTLYEFFPDQPSARLALEGNRMRLLPTAGGYHASWIAGGAAAWMAHSGAATQPAFFANGFHVFSPSTPVSTPFGPVPTLTISENGIVTCANTPNNGVDPTPSGSDIVGPFAPSLAFYSWRDFDLAEPGSGRIRYEEVTGGPETILLITWDGVEAAPATTANPSSWQLQIGMTTGTVDMLWSSWDSSNQTTDVLVGLTLPGTTATGADLDLGSTTLSTALPLTVRSFQSLSPLTLSASPAPSFSPGNPSVPITWTTENLQDLSPALPGAYLAGLLVSLNPPIGGTGVDLSALGVDAPGCSLLVGSIDFLITSTPVAATHNDVFSVPQPLSPGLVFYWQAVNFIVPNSLPNGLNNFGLLTSNGLASRFELF